MDPRVSTVSAVLHSALAPCNTARKETAIDPQGRGRTEATGRGPRPVRGVLDCAARSLRGATQFCPIGSSADPRHLGTRNEGFGREAAVTQKDFFAMLCAPLVNPRWSWGAVRKSDGAVILRVWKDDSRSHNGRDFVRINWKSRRAADRVSHGRRERVAHVELIMGGARCYLIICEAEDPRAKPRRVKRFNSEEIFPGGPAQERDDGWWVELRSALPVSKFLKQATRCG